MFYIDMYFALMFLRPFDTIDLQYSTVPVFQLQLHAFMPPRSPCRSLVSRHTLAVSHYRVLKYKRKETKKGSQKHQGKPSASLATPCWSREGDATRETRRGRGDPYDALREAKSIDT